MKRSTTPSFILTLPLILEPWQYDKLETDFFVSCNIYNNLRRECLNRYNQMCKTREYKYWLKTYRNSKSNAKLHKEAKLHLEEMRKRHRLSEYEFQKDIKEYQHHFNKNINSIVAQKLATRLWQAFEKVLFDNATTVHFKRYDEFTSIEGKNNSTGIIFRNNQVIYNKTILNVQINKKDPYVVQALCNNVKYCRIKRCFVRGKNKYYIQLTLAGSPPLKCNKDTGEIKHSLGKGRVGLDVGPQTLAIVSSLNVKLVELADKVQNIEKELRRVNRAMDRSRRATNPGFFNEDGTIIKRKPKETREWVKTNRYKKLEAKRKELYRLQAVIRKQQHFELANFICTLGNEVYIEDMNFAALAKRTKKTEKSEKTGKFKSKKRFGKSLANKSPAMFVSILENKLRSKGGNLYKVNTSEMKASQYQHDSRTYKKSKLSQRTKEIAGHTVQRDLYSAFLLMNSDITLCKPNQEMCDSTFDNFITLHNEEVKRLKTLSSTPSSMGINKLVA